MSKFIDMTPSEQYVRDLFEGRYRVSLKKIDDNDGKNGQEPDFEYLENEKRIFVCELKEYETINPSEEAGWEKIHHPDGAIGFTRTSRAPDKIKKSIYKAYQQLKKYAEPKILIFLNHYPGLNVKDLEETFTGFSEYKIGGRRVVDNYYRRASERVIEEKSKIDLYIWIDTPDKNSSLESDNIYMRTVTNIGQKLAEAYFSAPAKE